MKKLVKFQEQELGEVIIATTTKALSDLGWSFDSDDVLSESEFIERYPRTDLYFHNTDTGMGCQMVNFATDQERSNFGSVATENPSDDYERTKEDIIYLLENGLAEIYSSDNDDMFSYV